MIRCKTTTPLRKPTDRFHAKDRPLDIHPAQYHSPMKNQDSTPGANGLSHVEGHQTQGVHGRTRSQEFGQMLSQADKGGSYETLKARAAATRASEDATTFTIDDTLYDSPLNVHTSNIYHICLYPSAGPSRSYVKNAILMKLTMKRNAIPIRSMMILLILRNFLDGMQKHRRQTHPALAAHRLWVAVEAVLGTSLLQLLASDLA